MPRITYSCSCIYVLGCRLSVVRLCDSDFGIAPVDGITIGITCAAFCFHIAHIAFASSWYLFCLLVIVLVRLCVFGTAVSVKMVFSVFLFIKVMSGRLKGTVLSVSVLRFQFIVIISLLCNFLINYLSIWRSWLRYCATSRKIAGLIPDGVTGIFHIPCRTMALRSTQPLTEVSTRDNSKGGKGGRCVGLTTLPPSCADCLEICERKPPATPTGPVQACNGIA